MSPAGKLIRMRCPRCGKEFECRGPASHKSFPFCSSRCQMIDLGNWLSERYVIPGNRCDTSNSMGDDAESETPPDRTPPRKGK